MKTHILIENNSNNNSHGSINVTREWKTLTKTTTTIANKTPKWRQKLPICLTKWLAINVHTQSSGWQPVCRRARKGQREQLIDKSAERERECRSLSHALSSYCARFWKSCCSYCCCCCSLHLQIAAGDGGRVCFVSNFHWLMTVLHSIS